MCSAKEFDPYPEGYGVSGGCAGGWRPAPSPHRDSVAPGSGEGVYDPVRFQDHGLSSFSSLLKSFTSPSPLPTPQKKIMSYIFCSFSGLIFLHGISQILDLLMVIVCIPHWCISSMITRTLSHSALSSAIYYARYSCVHVIE